MAARKGSSHSWSEWKKECVSRRNVINALFIPLCLLFSLKKTDFKENVVSDVTSETTFSLKPIFLLERKDEGCMCSMTRVSRHK